MLEADKARQYGIDRVPAIAVVGQDETGAERDSSMRFLGTPAGYEFISLITRDSAGRRRASQLSEDEPGAPGDGRRADDAACVHDADLSALSARGQPGARDGVGESEYHAPTPSRSPSTPISRAATTSPACPRRSSTNDRDSRRASRGRFHRQALGERSMAEAHHESPRLRTMSSRHCRLERPSRCGPVRALRHGDRCSAAGAGSDFAARRRSPIASPSRARASLDAGRGDVSPISAAPLELRMSRSSPGRYSLHDFAKNVYDVQAIGADGRELTTTRPDPYGWTVPQHGASR